MKNIPWKWTHPISNFFFEGAKKFSPQAKRNGKQFLSPTLNKSTEI